MEKINGVQWVYLYIATAPLMLLATRFAVVVVREKKLPSRFFGEVQDMLRTDLGPNQTSRDRLEKWIFWILGVLAWPLVVLIALSVSLSNKYVNKRAPDPESEFTIKSAHLLRTVLPEDVERQATVNDPLEKVPAVPFGHLNPGWTRLLSSMEDGDLLWYGEVPGYRDNSAAEYGRPQYALPRGIKRGYAVARKGKVVADFLFEWD